MFPKLLRFSDLGLLLLRLMVGAIFVTSGRSHLKDPEGRSKSIEMSKGFTVFLGAGELAGGLGVTFGVLAQIAAAGLTLIMLGAIQKKMFVWKTGFWGKGSQGWHYELMLVVMNLVIISTDGGRYSLWSGPRVSRSLASARMLASGSQESGQPLLTAASMRMR